MFIVVIAGLLCAPAACSKPNTAASFVVAQTSAANCLNYEDSTSTRSCCVFVWRLVSTPRTSTTARRQAVPPLSYFLRRVADRALGIVFCGVCIGFFGREYSLSANENYFCLRRNVCREVGLSYDMPDGKQVGSGNLSCV